MISIQHRLMMVYMYQLRMQYMMFDLTVVGLNQVNMRCILLYHSHYCNYHYYTAYSRFVVIDC